MISIVIPTHKRVNLLKKTINSALDQTYKNTEIIVVSDGYDKETDLYMKTIENNQIKYYVYETNRGANYARNYGVKHSEGEYIAFLDDDDQWAKDKLERQNTELSKDNDYGLVYTGNKQLYIDTNDSFIYEPTISGDLSREIFSKNHIGSTSSVLIKKEIFDEVNGFDEKLGALQDYDLWIRVCQIAKIGVISAPLLIYTNDRNREQISNQINKYEDAAIQIKEKYKDFFSNNKDLEKGFSLFLSKVIIKKYLRNNNKKKAREISLRIFWKTKRLSILPYYFSTFFSYDMLLKFKAMF